MEKPMENFPISNLINVNSILNKSSDTAILPPFMTQYFKDPLFWNNFHHQFHQTNQSNLNAHLDKPIYNDNRVDDAKIYQKLIDNHQPQVQSQNTFAHNHTGNNQNWFLNYFLNKQKQMLDSINYLNKCGKTESEQLTNNTFSSRLNKFSLEYLFVCCCFF